jgi:hypothetical protein
VPTIIRSKPLLRWISRLALAVGVAYGLLLTYPQPLFAYELRAAGIVLHADRPIPEAMRATLHRVRARLDRSAIAEPARVQHVFVCQARWRFAVFARNNYRVGGIANVYIGQHVFLRDSDMDRDRLIGPGGRPVPADRPLSYFIAHEIMHIEHVRLLGRVGYLRLPQWADDGHADYVARDIDLAKALVGFKSGERELDPARSGLYVRYQLMVAYLIEKRHLEPRVMLAHPGERDAIEHELAGLASW